MSAAVSISDQIRALMADADDLVARILDARFAGESCAELVDDLSDVVDRIDMLAAQLNGADE